MTLRVLSLFAGIGGECASERLAGPRGSQMADAAGLRWSEGHQDAGGSREGTRAPEEWQGLADGGWWSAEPNVGRVAHGIPKRVDRLRCLGNAVVPQIPELIGRAILAAIADRSATAPRRETGVARKGESGGASAIAQGQIT